MSNDFQAQPPPSYTEVIDKSVPPVTPARAEMYTVHPQEPVGEIKYPTVNPTVNPTMPMAYGVQVVTVPTFSRNPVQCTCGHCRSMIITRVEESSGLLAWLICAFLVLFGCWLGCCLIPFCISDLKNVQHYCPNCNAFIGEYRPL